MRARFVTEKEGLPQPPIRAQEDTAEDVTGMVFSCFDCFDIDPRWSGNPFDKNHKLNGTSGLRATTTFGHGCV